MSDGRMHRHRAPGRSLAVAGVVALTCALLGAAGARAAASPQGAKRVWSIVPSEYLGPASDYLDAVAMISSDDGWAVGTQSPVGGNALIERWNGTRWRAVTAPAVDGYSIALAGVAAVSATDVWAAGCYVGPGSVVDTLIEHWNGRRWHVVPSPNSPLGDSCLLDVSALGPDDVWAVGAAHRPDYTGGAPLVEHFDGASWSLVPAPGDPSRYQEQSLRGVEAISADDVWAVGYTWRDSGSPHRPLAMHWDGTRWRKVPTPDLRPDGGVLDRASASSGSDLWAVGDLDSGSLLVEHFDGVSWSVVAAPTPQAHSDLGTVVALSPTNAWVVGDSWADGANALTLTEHWNGIRWRVVDSPSVVDPDGYKEESYLSGLDALGPGELWAVGAAGLPDSSDLRPLAERYGVP